MSNLSRSCVELLAELDSSIMSLSNPEFPQDVEDELYIVDEEFAFLD